MAPMNKQQYQHFIPQFLLKNFSRPVIIDANTSRTKRRKHYRKTGQYPDDHLLNSVNLSSEPFILEECVVQRTFGLFDMYDDDDEEVKIASRNRRRIEEKFGRLESHISKIYSRIITEHNKGMPSIWLTRIDKDLLRKWIFLLKYRGSGLHQRYRQDARDYSDRDREILRNYMIQEGIERPFDVWLRNLEAILDLKMDPENEWKAIIRKQIYPPDAEWFINQVTEMYMTICTPAKEDEEFILTENHCNIREGPTAWVEDKNTGETMIRDSFTFHEFAPISPKLMFVLRNGYLPGGSNDPDESVQIMRQAILAAIYSYLAPGTRSLLHDLPVQKADNSYTVHINGQPYERPGWDGKLRQDDTFGFPFFRIDTMHMQKINGLLLDHAFHGTKIIYSNRERFLNLIKWFLIEPCEVGKNIEGAHADRHLQYVHSLAALMKSVGWEGQVIWKEWPNQKIPSMEAFRNDFLAKHLSMQAFMKGERPCPADVISDLQTPYGRFPDPGLKGKDIQEHNHQNDVLVDKHYNQQRSETEQQSTFQAHGRQLDSKQALTQPQDSVHRSGHTEQDDDEPSLTRESEVKQRDDLKQRDYDEESDAEGGVYVHQPFVNYKTTNEKHAAQQVNDTILSVRQIQRSEGDIRHEERLKPLTLRQLKPATEVKPCKLEIIDHQSFLDLGGFFMQIILPLPFILLALATICTAIVEMAIITLTGVLSGLKYITSELNNILATIDEHQTPKKLFARHELSEEGHDSPGIKTPSSLAKDSFQHEPHKLPSERNLESKNVSLDPNGAPLDHYIRKLESRGASDYVSLRSETAFPNFQLLPLNGYIDPFYFHVVGGSHPKPRRHWCFLAEIMDVENISPLRLTVRDKTDLNIPVAFHTDANENELEPFLIRKGNTIAVLYAESHQVTSFPIGIRYIDPRMLKIFPMALKNLLSLSDRVQRYSTVNGDLGICHGCDRKADSLKGCKKCLLFRYCDKTCQSVGWNNKGHKIECKIVRDPDFRGLLRLNWNGFEEYHRFC